MNTLKSILLSSALVTSTFGAEATSLNDADVNGPPTIKAHRAKAKTKVGERPRDAKGRFVRKTYRADDNDAINNNCGEPSRNKGPQTEGKPSTIGKILQELLGVMTSFLPREDLISALIAVRGEVISEDVQERKTLIENCSSIVASLLFSKTPVHEVMMANGFADSRMIANGIADLRMIMSTLGIKEDVFGDRPIAGRYDQADRTEIAQKLAMYAGKSIVTASDIVAGIAVNDGDVVMLGYDDMVTHKASLDGKDIHLCVDVYADANGQLVLDKNNLPKGLKRLYFANSKQDVRTIGDSFLSFCNSLTHVDLTRFKTLTTIGHSFLSNCSSLTHANLSGLTNLTTIGDGFLPFCYSLTHADLSGLTNLRAIGNWFLSYCDSLTHANLSGVTNVRTIGDYFLSRCLQLQNIIAPKSLALLIPAELKEKIVEVD